MQTFAPHQCSYRQPSDLGSSPNSLNQRRGRSELIRFSIDLAGKRPELEQAARAKAYPSPPMSGSPSLPPNPIYETGERSHGSYQTRHDAYQRASAATPPHSVDMRVYSQLPASNPDPLAQHQPSTFSHSARSYLSRPYSADYHDRYPYASYGRPADHQVPSSTGYMPTYAPSTHLQGPPATAGYGPYTPQYPGPSSMQPGYPSSPHASASTQFSSPAPVDPARPNSVPPYASPKSHRKTKGHVASACVPCKRAHLRCDCKSYNYRFYSQVPYSSQRPCSRCMSNGKEDACVDVQHKKRGRPRLREERDSRPLSLYGQPSTSLGSGFIERVSASDASVFSPALPISARALEPAAFMTTDLEMAKASDIFLDAIGRQSVKGLSLLDLVCPVERGKVVTIQRQIHDERDRKDPQYLPPIFAKRDEERVIQSLGLSADDLSRYAMYWHEYLSFNTIDGQQRTYPVRLGLAKQDSIYFIVLSLHVVMRPYGQPAPLSQPRDVPYAYQTTQQHASPQHQIVPQPAHVSASFDSMRPHMPGEVGSLPHRTTPSGGPSPMLSGLSPSTASAYGPSTGRSEYTGGPPLYQTPRSELVLNPPWYRQPQQAPTGSSSCQLPPIQNHQDQRHMDSSTNMRDEKSRVDIGGLIENPPRRMY